MGGRGEVFNNVNKIPLHLYHCGRECLIGPLRLSVRLELVAAYDGAGLPTMGILNQKAAKSLLKSLLQSRLLALFRLRNARFKIVQEIAPMTMKKRDKQTSLTRVESQDDAAYLTGQRSSSEMEKQIRTPSPRKTGRLRWAKRKEEADSDSEEER
jgi:cell division GTPase FtsZ